MNWLEGLKGVFVMLFILSVVYGTYWVAKHGSYFFFYEEMMQQTVKEMVKPEYLK